MTNSNMTEKEIKIKAIESKLNDVGEFASIQFVEKHLLQEDMPWLIQELRAEGKRLDMIFPNGRWLCKHDSNGVWVAKGEKCDWCGGAEK